MKSTTMILDGRPVKLCFIKVFLFLLPGVLLSGISYGQDSTEVKTYELPEKRSYKYAFIGINDTIEYQVTHVELGNDSASFKLNKIMMTVPYSDLAYLRVPVKGKALGGLIIGFGATVAGSIVMHNYAKNNPDFYLGSSGFDKTVTFFEEHEGSGRYGVAVLFGSLIGVFIGNNMKTYKVYHFL